MFKGFIPRIIDSLQEKTRLREEKYKLLASGNVPEVTHTNLLLKKEEVCHYSISAKRIIKVTKIIQKTRSNGISFKIAKKLMIESKYSSQKPKKIEESKKYEGNFYITNRRIVFLAREKGIDIPFSKIDGTKFYKNGIEFFINNKSIMFKISNVKELSATIDGVRKKYQVE